MNAENAPERRQYKRFQKHFLLTYWNLADPQVRHEATQLKNISWGGMCLITAKQFPPGTILGIELKTPFHSELTHSEGMVISSVEKLKGIIYETHFQFRELSPMAEFSLKKLIEHFENQKKDPHE